MVWWRNKIEKCPLIDLAIQLKAKNMFKILKEWTENLKQDHDDSSIIKGNLT